MSSVLNIAAKEQESKRDSWRDRHVHEKLAKHLKYPQYAPFLNDNDTDDPNPEFEHVDPGLRADADLKNLLAHGLKAAEAAQSLTTSEQLVKYGYSVNNLTPKFGSEVHGIQVSQLDEKAKDDLARFVAERGVVVFRDQNLRDLPIDQIVEWARHFGRLNVHRTAAAPVDQPNIIVVYRDENNKDEDLRRSIRSYFGNKVSHVGWHSDVSFERQPASLTFLAALEVPNSGGDTLFLDTEEVYNRLSPSFRQRLHGLKALHSGVAQVEGSLANGGIARHAAVESEHPVVRTHAVTGRNSIFVNKGFTRNIVGYKKEESDALLNFLYDIQAQTQDAQVRVRWEDGTITFWDNRRTLHSAIADWEDDQKRVLFRLTPQGEVPFGPEN